MGRYTYEQRVKFLSTSNLTEDKRKRLLKHCRVCNLVLTIRALKKDPSFKPSILSRVDSLEDLDNNAQGMYRMMRSLEKRGLVARVLHRRPAVWIYVSWHDGRPKLERKSDGWYDFNHVMYRDGQVLFKTKDKEWIIRGAKMSSTQFKLQIEQQILDMERRKQENQKS
jgi:hypothetical protein